MNLNQLLKNLRGSKIILAPTNHLMFGTNFYKCTSVVSSPQYSTNKSPHPNQPIGIVASNPQRPKRKLSLPSHNSCNCCKCQMMLKNPDKLPDEQPEKIDLRKLQRCPSENDINNGFKTDLVIKRIKFQSSIKNCIKPIKIPIPNIKREIKCYKRVTSEPEEKRIKINHSYLASKKISLKSIEHNKTKIEPLLMRSVSEKLEIIKKIKEIKKPKGRIMHIKNRNNHMKVNSIECIKKKPKPILIDSNRYGFSIIEGNNSQLIQIGRAHV